MELEPGKKMPSTTPPVPQLQPMPVPVTVKPEGSQGLTFNPELAQVRRRDWVVWDDSKVSIPPGGSVVIEFTDVSNGNKGPFPKDPADNHNIARGTYKCKRGHAGEHPLKTAPVEQVENPPQGFWKYEFSVLDAEGKRIRFADPGVAIIEGGGVGDEKGH